eukprot:TRINITY_DN2331_c0_g3_i1.p1 TRINITY_DN2331_c0_g3~~TRINITY_DN2331_c0_g3_i1.p1  ORF type:complete len:1664 (-),score=495.17 TRINITY_DN2331_c0_g3_i1:82-5073(-)
MGSKDLDLDLDMDEDRGGNNVDSSEEEGEDEPNEYDLDDGFVVQEETKKKKNNSNKKKRKRPTSNRSTKGFKALDDDDLDLIGETSSVSKPPSFKKQKRNDHRNDDVAPEALIFGEEDDDRPERSRADKESSSSEKRTNSNSQNGDDDDLGLSDAESDEDDIRDWLVDDDGDAASSTSRAPRPRPRRVGPGSMSGSAYRASAEKMMDATDIFGVDLDSIGEEFGIGGHEEEDEFEDNEEGKAARREKRRKQILEKGKALLRTVYEPSLLQEKFFTKEDEQIKKRDLPERLQVSINSTVASGSNGILEWFSIKESNIIDGVLTSEDLSFGREAEWIYSRVFANEAEDYRRREDYHTVVVTKIIAVLEFLRKDHFEVPYIARYKKDSYLPELSSEDLWQIHDMDWKYLFIVLKKASLRVMYNTINYATSSDFGDEEGSEPLVLDTDFLTNLDSAQNETEVKDLYDFFQMHYGQKLEQFKQKKLEREKDRERDRDRDRDREKEKEKDNANKYKRPVKRNFYALSRRAGITELANKSFGMTAKEFGINLKDAFKHKKPVDLELAPDSVARDWLDSHDVREFSGEESVLKACRAVLSQEIAFDPQVRNILRSIYTKNVYVSTRPTAKGLKQISDQGHPYASVKRLEKKPVSQFKGTQFLLIVKGEKEGFLSVTISNEQVSNSDDIDLQYEMSKFYLSDGYSASAQAWNKQREMILKQALTEHLYPLFRGEIRTKLLTEAMERASYECAQKLRERLMVGRFRAKPRYRDRRSKKSSRDDDDSSEDEEKRKEDERITRGCKVISCVWGGEDLPCYVVGVDENGEPVKLPGFRLDYLGYNKVIPASQQLSGKASPLEQKRQEDQDKVFNFIKEFKPDIIVIGASSGEIQSRKFFKTISDLADKVYNEDESMPRRITVTWADSQVARIYQDSERAKKEFGTNTPAPILHAISLARCTIDPLLEHAGLCGNAGGIGESVSVITDTASSGQKKQDEILCLRLHTLQDLVSKELLMKKLIRVFIDVVNRVGVDINKCASYKWASYVLQFVSGFGPRKADALLSAIIRKGGRVISRRAVKNLLLLETSISSTGASINPSIDAMDEDDNPRGNKDKDKDRDDEKNGTQLIVFTNAAGFLRIRKYWMPRPADKSEPAPYYEVLDDTRVHPVDYYFARKMTADTIETQVEEDGWKFLVSELMKDAKLLDQLEDINLEQFAEEWERSGQGKIATILNDIKDELRDPFRDPRREWRPLDDLEIFYLLTGETRDSLRDGLEPVMARVVRMQWPNNKPIPPSIQVGNGGALVEVGQGIDGYLKELERLDNKALKVGEIIPCRVLKIIPKEYFMVELIPTRKDSYYRDALSSGDGARDPYLLDDDELEAENRTHQQEEAKKKLAASQAEAVTALLNNNRARKINHPKWDNVTYRDAEKKLNNLKRAPGEDTIIIRPSSKGADHLTISWKLVDGIIIHTDVIETTASGGRAGMSSKKILMINDKTFEDFDEIIYTYIIPMVQKAKEVVDFRYFKKDDKKQVEKRMVEEKGKNKERIPYYIIVNKEIVGKFSLYYMPGDRPKHELITITAEGFKFRNIDFSNVDELIKWFKVHYKEPISGPGSKRDGGGHGMSGNGSNSGYGGGRMSGGGGNNNGGYGRMSQQQQQVQQQQSQIDAPYQPDTNAWD